MGIKKEIESIESFLVLIEDFRIKNEISESLDTDLNEFYDYLMFRIKTLCKIKRELK